MPSSKVLFLLLSVLSLTIHTSAKKVTECEVLQELKKAGIPACLHGHVLCMIKYESNFDTSYKTGPLCKASYSHGIFQIDSCTWCSNYRPDGKCKIHCDKLRDNNIQDDVACAKMILDTVGLKYWKKWEKNCKGKTPKVPICGKSADSEDEEVEYEVGEDELTTFEGDNEASNEESMTFKGDDVLQKQESMISEGDDEAHDEELNTFEGDNEGHSKNWTSVNGDDGGPEKDLMTFMFEGDINKKKSILSKYREHVENKIRANFPRVSCESIKGGTHDKCQNKCLDK